MTLTNYKTTNNASSTLASGIGAGATSLVCATGQGGRFPSTFPFLITIEKTVADVVTKREIVKVTNRSSDAFTIVRSAGYCLASDSATTQTNTAQSFDSGDVISLRLTGEIIDDVNAELSRLETDKLDIADFQNGEKVYASTSTGTDAYAITLTPAITAYVTAQTFRFSADVANTWSATLNVNGLGAKTIKKQHDVDLDSGDIEAGQFVMVTYDGTNFQMNSQIATIPTVNINGETEDTVGDMDADFMHVYDNSAGANRKQKPNVYRATNAEVNTGSSTSKFTTPNHLKRVFGKFARTNSAASNTQTIAHGLGRTPRFVELDALYYLSSNEAVFATSNWKYDGTTTNSISVQGNNGPTVTANSTTNVISIICTSHSHVCTISVDATNITLTWTSSGGSGTNDIQVIWQAI